MALQVERTNMKTEEVMTWYAGEWHKQPVAFVHAAHAGGETKLVGLLGKKCFLLLPCDPSEENPVPLQEGPFLTELTEAQVTNLADGHSVHGYGGKYVLQAVEDDGTGTVEYNVVFRDMDGNSHKLKTQARCSSEALRKTLDSWNAPNNFYEVTVSRHG